MNGPFCIRLVSWLAAAAQRVRRRALIGAAASCEGRCFRPARSTRCRSHLSLRRSAAETCPPPDGCLQAPVPSWAWTSGWTSPSNPIAASGSFRWWRYRCLARTMRRRMKPRRSKPMLQEFRVSFQNSLGSHRRGDPGLCRGCGIHTGLPKVKVRRSQVKRTVEPVVLRASRSSCALRVSFNA